MGQSTGHSLILNSSQCNRADNNVNYKADYTDDQKTHW